MQQVAAAELAADEDYRAELERWTLSRHRCEGVPWYAFGPRPSRRGLPLRDFGLCQPNGGRDIDDFSARPQLAALISAGDEPEDWLRTGQALQRVLLTAARHGVSASFLTQPLDVREMSGRADPAGFFEHVQMIIRFGYGPPTPGSPRRPYADVLDGGM